MTHRWLYLGTLLATATGQRNDGCKVPAIINGSSGTFASPYYDMYPAFSYPNDAKCRWTINVTPGKNTRFTFSNPMALESCMFDWVAIWPVNRYAIHAFVCEGGLEAAEIGAEAGPFCPPSDEPVAPEPFVLAGSSFDVEFCTDSNGA
ncbi:hypothetical protein BV898_17178 [Hypsibius exemplaris]|uniref:CUB domain-containing protein n=1 Tax=Hypsibius exemplaris TaxID=2072580 RepID=A0A9X6NH83_HYPEX|nr:hypothetical protein BV898_17178 [Hypsibius exemplaris]